MITVELVGDKELVAKLNFLPDKLRRALARKLTASALTMVANVKRKLSGTVLNVRTGNLRDSIEYTLNESATSVEAKVFSGKSVKYAAIHEFGGQTSPHDIYPAKAQALAFMMGGKQVFAKVVHHPGSKIPERSYMRSTLGDMREEIIEGMNDALKEALL
jgi:HK97 gp10 family phage protein